jgi:cation diffusion facilitator CzcD-associated flavoprotein CzcO
VLYSLSFALKPGFSTLYPSQPEILAYMQDLSKKYLLEKHYYYNRKLLHATWDEVSRTWLIRSQDLETGRIYLQRCKILISAIGNLSKTSIGEIENTEVFKGRILHTAEWDSSVALVKKNVALVGNGSR